ncbi:Hint domain-containing protein [Leisingera sp. S232]
MGIPCFAAGTLIETAQGAAPIETLVEGDLVKTRDHGLQPIRWIGWRTVDASGDLAPICIKAGTLGNDRDLLVSPQHRILVTGWKASLLFGEEEVLAPAKALVNDKTILWLRLPAITYCHMLFDNHEVILSEGMWTESLHAGQVAIDALGDESRREILSIFPELEKPVFNETRLARTALRVKEAQILAGYL